MNVARLEEVIEDLRSLRPDRVEMAAAFIRRLREVPVTPEERQAALARTFGCLSLKEADELESVIEKGCKKVDEDGWQPLH